MSEPKQQPQLVLFGASMIEWSFDKEKGGFGWVMQHKYAGKAEVVNEGKMPVLVCLLQSRQADGCDCKEKQGKPKPFRRFRSSLSLLYGRLT